MSASSEWRQVERQLADLDLDVSDVLKPKELQRLFLEVRGELAAEQVYHCPSRNYFGCVCWGFARWQENRSGQPILWLARPLESWGLPNNRHACLHPHTGHTTGNSFETGTMLQGFKALLESALDITARTSWPLAKRQVRIHIHGCSTGFSW